MDADGYGEVRSSENAIDFKDVDMFMNLKSGSDNRLSKREFMRAINQTLFTLVLEEALKSDNPKKYYKSLGHTHNSVENALFPNETVTYGKKELLQILKFFDADGDQSVSRTEIRAKYMQHKVEVA